jgi:hypothetical protein
MPIPSYTPVAGAGVLSKTLPPAQRIRLRKDSVGESFAPALASLTARACIGRAGSRKDQTMQRVTLVRYRAKPDRANENEALSRAVFDELRAKAPDNVAYALFRDGLDFVHLFINLEADDSSTLTELPSFKAFSRDGAERFEAPPDVTRLGLDLIESYGLARTMAPA